MVGSPRGRAGAYVALAVLALHEIPSPTELTGMALIVGALVVNSRSPRAPVVAAQTD